MPSSRTHRQRNLFDPQFIRNERRRSYRMACILFWSILMTWACQRYVVTAGVITERSMEPTLPEGSYFLVNKYAYRFHRPQRGDIVVLTRGIYDEDEVVKRVIGLEGDVLTIHRGRVWLNGQRLLEPYAVGRTAPNFGPYRIPAGHSFVLGDNRPVSFDSRAFGDVPLRYVEGKLAPGQFFPFW